MVLRLSPEVLEDRLLPISFHVIPIIDHSMANRIMYPVTGSLGVRERLVANEEVEIFNAAFGGEVSGLGRDWGTCTARLSGGTARSDGSWKNAVIIASKSNLLRVLM